MAPSSGVSRRAEVRPILQRERSPDLGRLLRRAPAATALRVLACARPRLPRPGVQCRDAPSPAVSRVVAGTP